MFILDEKSGCLFQMNNPAAFLFHSVEDVQLTNEIEIDINIRNCLKMLENISMK